MKKYLVCFLISSFTMANFLNTSFIAKILERSNRTEKEYVLQYKPNNIKVEVLFPSTNKGEIYTYKQGKKYIYYPKLNQTVEQTLSNSSNDIFKLLSEMRGINKSTRKGNKEYIVKNGNITKIICGSLVINVTYINNMPIKINIQDGKEKVEYLWSY
ncbi:hypothetical protein ACF3OF_05190 [Sneathia vaginalis]|uniref:hypothetical protein n=1 Tax=Sneathia vaginalis TaxID=187101 RepID=UPI00370D4D66